jgi:hypothetical protein
MIVIICGIKRRALMSRLMEKPNSIRVCTIIP